MSSACSVCRPAGVGRKYYGREATVTGYSAANNRLFVTLKGEGTRDFSIRWANILDMCYLASFDNTDRPPPARTTGILYFSDEWAVAQVPDLASRGDPKHPKGADGAVRSFRQIEIAKSYFAVRIEDQTRQFDGKAYWIEDAYLDLTEEVRFGLRAVLTPQLFTAPDETAVLRWDKKPVPTQTATPEEFAELQGAPVVVLEYAQDTTIIIPSGVQGETQRKRAFIDFSIPFKADPRRQPYFDPIAESWAPVLIDEKYLTELPLELPPENPEPPPMPNMR